MRTLSFLLFGLAAGWGGFGWMEAAARPEATRPLVEAACRIKDSLEGRLGHGSLELLGRPEWERQLYDLRTSATWEWLLLLAGGLMCGLAFVEDPQSIHGRCHAGAGVLPFPLLLELLCLGIFGADILMKRGRYNLWQRFYAGIVAALVVDAVAGSVCGQRPLRILRPALIGLRHREQRQVLLGVTHMFATNLGLALAVTIGGVLVAGALGVHLFGKHYDTGLQIQYTALEPDAAAATESLAHSSLRGAFDSFIPASLEAWVLVSSAENFPALLMPAMFRADGTTNFWPTLYFAPLLYFGYFFVMSVLLAVVVDEYMLTARRLVSEENHKERKGLLRAFKLLDPQRTGHVRLEVWISLLRELRPGMSVREAEIRFHMMAPTDRGIHVLQFLNVGANLAISLEELALSERQWLPSMPPALRCALLATTAVLFCAYSPNLPAETQRVMFTVHSATLPLLLLDSNSWAVARRATNIACLGSASLCAAVYWAAVGLESTPPAPSTFAGQLALIILLAQMSPVLRLIARLLAYVLVQFSNVTISLLLVVYAFALLGMQCFHTVQLATAPGSDELAHEQLGECDAPFSTLPCTLLLLFQVMSSEDWHLIMRAMHTTAGGSGLTYILAFYLVINVCLLSLMTALTINTFLGAKADLMQQGVLVDTTSEPTPPPLSRPPSADELVVPASAPSSTDARGGPPMRLQKFQSSEFVGPRSSIDDDDDDDDEPRARTASRRRPPSLQAANMGWSSRNALTIADTSVVSAQLQAAQQRMLEQQALEQRLTAEPPLLAIRPDAPESSVGLPMKLPAASLPAASAAGDPSAASAPLAWATAWLTPAKAATSADAPQSLLEATALRSDQSDQRPKKVAIADPPTAQSTFASAEGSGPPMRLSKFESNDYIDPTSAIKADVYSSAWSSERLKRKWRVASHTATVFSRRAAAGLMMSEEPLDIEESAAIAKLTGAVDGDISDDEWGDGILGA